MSVCFVSADQSTAEDGDTLQLEEESQGGNGEAHFALAQFWERVMEDVRKVSTDDYKQQVLPLARVKKIMKLDEDVKMISAEAPLLFAKAAEIFIHELTLRAWVHTEDNKRRTLQRNDIAMAIIKSDQFDFLIDIVPRQEIKMQKLNKEENVTRTGVSQDQVQYYFQLAQQHQAALQTPQVVSSAQIQQAQTLQATQASNSAPQIIQVTTSAPQQQQQVVQQQQQSQQQGQQAQQQNQQNAIQIVHQVVTPSGEIQHIPIQLTQSQLNLIRMQIQSGSNQPIIIQAPSVAAGQSQIIQVGQQQQPQQVYLTQVEGE